MHQMTSFCSAALVLAAAQWNFTPTPHGPEGRPRAEGGGATVATLRAGPPRAGPADEAALRKLQQQLSWDRRPAVAVPHKGHTANCRCQRPDRPPGVGADGLLEADGVGMPRPPVRSPRSSRLPPALRREGP